MSLVANRVGMEVDSKLKTSVRFFQVFTLVSQINSVKTHLGRVQFIQSKFI